MGKARLRAWDHYPVAVKIEGKELKVGCVLKSEEMIQKFKKQVLCPEDSRSWVDCGQEGELVSLQERLEAAAIKATTTATWNKNKFGVP